MQWEERTCLPHESGFAKTFTWHSGSSYDWIDFSRRNKKNLSSRNFLDKTKPRATVPSQTTVGKLDMSSYKGNIGLISWKSPKHNYGRDSNLEEVELKTFRYQSRSLIVKKKWFSGHFTKWPIMESSGKIFQLFLPFNSSFPPQPILINLSKHTSKVSLNWHYKPQDLKIEVVFTRRGTGRWDPHPLPTPYLTMTFKDTWLALLYLMLLQNRRLGNGAQASG